MALARRSVVVLAGGVSGEHSVSLRSAAAVVAALDEAGFEVTTVGISPRGQWLLDDLRPLLGRARTDMLEIAEDGGRRVTIVKDGGGARLLALDGDAIDAAVARVEVVFPVLHGPGGEDGTVQGFLDLLGVPCVGAGCTASALAMDKVAMKTLCAGAGIAQVDYLAAGRHGGDHLGTAIERSFGFPCFVKPANLGSSVGITYVEERHALGAALETARRWDRRVVIEQAVDAREIEIAMLGNDEPAISPAGEIIAEHGFYDFATKYVDDQAQLVIGAELSDAERDVIDEIAKRVWDLIGCRGMARADFFIERSSGRVLFNELNTIPGFTEISMYPRLWEAAGLSHAELVGRLVDLALESEEVVT